MKYDAAHIEPLLKALKEGQGRVRACKVVDIHYSTFLDWMQNKAEFSEAVKKAEAVGEDKIADICRRRIIEDPSWQSAAWWLERNFPERYANRERQDVHMIITKTVNDVFPEEEAIDGPVNK